MPTLKRTDFERRASELIWEWTDRKKLNGEPAESPNAWFKRTAYHLLRDVILRGDEHLLEEVVRRDKRPHRLVEEAVANPFKLGLLAMTVDESITRSNRHVFGNQMLYAHRHGVPSEFLNGFIAASGKPAVIGRKLKEGFVEPGFEERAAIPKILASENSQ